MPINDFASLRLRTVAFFIHRHHKHAERRCIRGSLRAVIRGQGNFNPVEFFWDSPLDSSFQRDRARGHCSGKP